MTSTGRGGIVDVNGSDVRYAVMVVLDPDTDAVLMTKRADHMRLHAGEMCFPGGKIEPGETTAQAAARELHEEIGLSSDRITPVYAPHLPQAATTYTTSKTFAVVYAHPRGGAEGTLDGLTLNPDEVSSAMWIRPDRVRVEPDTSDTGAFRIFDPDSGEPIVGATADVCLYMWEALGASPEGWR